MAITRFEDLPSENSPINSENLNGNFDELGVKVGTSVDNNYRTNIIKGKNGNASIVVDNEEIYSKPVVLWQNPSPTSAFAGQNITLSSDDYNYFEIIYSISNYPGYEYRKSSGIIPFETGKKVQLDGIDSIDYVLVGLRRIVTETSKTSFAISNNQFMKESSSSNNNIYIIPLKIIGYK